MNRPSLDAEGLDDLWDGVIRAGTVRYLDDAGARRLVQSVGAVLDALDDPGAPHGERCGPVSRVDLAARLREDLLAS